VLNLPLGPGVVAELGGDGVLLSVQGTAVRLSQTDGPPLSFRVEEMPRSAAYGQVTRGRVLRATLSVDGSTAWTLRFRRLEAPNERV
jgi:hypothetical protein